MTTDDPSEVRPGDVRRFEGVVIGEYHYGSNRWETSFGADDVILPAAVLAASTLIRRAKPEIKVGMRVAPFGGPAHGFVDAISEDGERAYLRSAPGHAAFPSSNGIPLSALTPVEDKADG